MRGEHHAVSLGQTSQDGPRESEQQVDIQQTLSLGRRSVADGRRMSAKYLRYREESQEGVRGEIDQAGEEPGEQFRERLADYRRTAEKGREDQKFAIVAGDPSQRVQDPRLVRDQGEGEVARRLGSRVDAGQLGGQIGESSGRQVRGETRDEQVDGDPATRAQGQQGLGVDGLAAEQQVEDRFRV